MSVERQRKRKWGIAVGVLVVGIAVTLVLLFRPSSEDGQPFLPDGDAEVGSEAPKPESPEARNATESKAELRLASSSTYDGALDPTLVIDNPDCVIREGFGAAESIATVAIPTPTGTRFSVLDGNGAIFGDELPFNPNHHRVGRRADGTVVAAFADLRLNQKGDRDPETLEPMRVYLDGAIIYEHEKVWDFGVADDGSSFYVIEPLAGDASRLIVHNLDLRRESHFDLGRLYTPWSRYDKPFGSSFAGDRASVMFDPAYADAYGRGTHWFFPVDGGERWSVELPHATDYTSPQWVNEALFASGTEAFVVKFEANPEGGEDIPRIAKRTYEPSLGQSEFKTLWSRTLDRSQPSLTLSDNGKWLGVGQTHLHVLNAETGETVFAFPTTQDLSRHLSLKEKWQVIVRPDGKRTLEGHLNDVATLARLTNVLGPNASLADVGGVGHILFRGDRLLMYRSTGSWPNRRTYYDVFDLDGINIDSPPTFRIELNRDYDCHGGDFYRQGLQVHDGQLTYLTTSR